MNEDVNNRIATTQKSIDDSKQSNVLAVVRLLMSQLRNDPTLCEECRKKVAAKIDMVLRMIE